MEDAFTKHKAKILSALDVFFTERFSISRGVVPYDHMIQEVAASAHRGKLFRGMCVCATYEAITGKTPSDTIYSIAAALEINHTAILIHDDIIDRSSLRRGMPTTVESYRKSLQSRIADYEHTSISLAICIADVCFFAVQKLLASTPEGNVAAPLFAEELEKVGFAEMADVYIGANAVSATIDDILSMYTYKTARYTFVLPLVVGARLAGASRPFESALDAIGEKLGIYFQIIDDELGIIGDEEVTGKPVASDIAEDKKTIHRHFLFQDADKNDTAELHKLFGKLNASATDAAEVQTYLKKYNTIQKARDFAMTYLRDVEDLIDRNTQFPPSLTELLRTLVMMNKNRNK